MMHRPARLPIIGLLMAVGMIVLVGAAPAAAFEPIVQPGVQFGISVPLGFVPDRELGAGNSRFVCAYRMGDDPMPGGRSIFIVVEKLGGTIGRDHLAAAQLPAGSKARLFTTKWQDFDVDATEVSGQIAGAPVVTYNAHIPLKPQAIQVRVLGPASRKWELNQILTRTLGGLKGQTNWVTSAIFGGMTEDSYQTVLLVIMIVGLGGGTVLLAFIAKRMPRGFTRGVAFFLYLVGMALREIRVREIVLVSGICGMLALVGFILAGIFALLKRRAQAAAVEASDPDAQMGDNPALW